MERGIKSVSSLVPFFFSAFCQKRYIILQRLCIPEPVRAEPTLFTEEKGEQYMTEKDAYGNWNGTDKHGGNDS